MSFESRAGLTLSAAPRKAILAMALLKAIQEVTPTSCDRAIFLTIERAAWTLSSYWRLPKIRDKVDGCGFGGVSSSFGRFDP
jgi:hypothetical protein